MGEEKWNEEEALIRKVSSGTCEWVVFEGEIKIESPYTNKQCN